MASRVRIGGTVWRGEVKPILIQAVMKIEACALTQEARDKPQLLEPLVVDPLAGGLGEERTKFLPYPIIRKVSGATIRLRRE